MMNNMLTAAALASTADTSGLIFQVPVVGLLMVFVVLSLIWAVLSVSKVVFYDIPRKRLAQANAQEQPQSAPAAAPAAPVVPAAAPVADDAAIVAAITAAIAAMRADEGCQGGFRVVSFRRADNGRAWNRK